MRKPLAELGLGKRISVLPPVIVDCAVVIPQGLPGRLMDCSALTRHRGIESEIPIGLQNAYGITLRFIEVKGGAKGATNVMVTKNEMLTALNKPKQYIFALLEVDSEYTHVIYLKNSFTSDLILPLPA